MSDKPIVLLGEALGEAEARLDSSFVGPSGAELLRQLNEAGVIVLSPKDHDSISIYYSTHDSNALERVWKRHEEVYRTNVFNLHPKANDLLTLCGPKSEGIPGYPILIKSKYARAEFEPELERLQNEILTIDPNLIVCLGNSALWSLTGRTGISKLRGTTLSSTHCVADCKLLGTYHPAAVLRQWELRPTAIADLMKAARESKFPEIRRPHREIWIEPDLDDIRHFINTYIRGCRLLSIDIETSGTRVTCIGFAPSQDRAIVIPFDDERAAGRSYWPTVQLERQCWKLITEVLVDVSIPKLLQNGAYDVSFLWRACGIKVMGAAEDTMLMHHALQPESLKALDYLGSIYSDEGAWKAEYRRHKKDKTIKRDS